MSKDSDLRELSMEIAMHHRIDPMTSRDHCICGYKAELGRMFTDHIAAEIIRRGWKRD